MRKVFFYLPEYPDVPTGGIKYHKILFEYFRQRTNEIYLLGNNRYAKIVDNSKLLKIISGLYYTFKTKRKSVIILSNTAFLHFAVPMLLNKLYKKHLYFMIVHHLVRNENPEFFRRKLEEYFIRNSDYVITISETTKQEMMKYGYIENRDIRIVPPGLDEIVCKKYITKSNNNPIKLLFVGTIEKRKGVIYCIEALNNLKNINFEFHVIGSPLNSDDYYEMVRNKVKSFGLENRIFFHGRVSDYDLNEYYEKSNIFLFPSLWEGYGMVIAEAMSHGLAIIASDIPSIRSIIDEKENGFLIRHDNSELLADKIRLLYNNRNLLEQFSVSSYKKAESFQTWDKTCKEIFNLVKMVRK